MFILALKNLRAIDQKLGKTFAYAELLAESENRTKEVFYRPQKGLYAMSVEGEEFTVLGNALAILAGIATAQESEYICEKIVRNELSDCSLSMKIFKYDALLAVDKGRYQVWVEEEIRREYAQMVTTGNTVWETIDGAGAFSNAGSLCHGWSAIPIRYLGK